MAGVDGVIHLAAKVDPVGDWADFEAINVEGTATVHAAARAAGVSRFVYVSSPSVAHDGSSISGDGAAPADPERAHGHYSVSKAWRSGLCLRPLTRRCRSSPFAPISSSGRATPSWSAASSIGPARAACRWSARAGARRHDLGRQCRRLAARCARCPPRSRWSGVRRVEWRASYRPRADRRITAAAGVDWSPRAVPARAAIAGGAAAEAVWERSGATANRR